MSNLRLLAPLRDLSSAELYVCFGTKADILDARAHACS